MGIKHAITRKTFEVTIDGAMKYINKDRETNLLKLVDMAQKIMGGSYPDYVFDNARELFSHPEEKWMQFMYKSLDELDPNIVKMHVLNLGYEAGLAGMKRVKEMREKYQCNVPWAILMDPTSACNLHCTGCWAAEYGHQMSLTFDQLDDIITQGKELGIHFYVMTGGEPLVRKDDIVKLAEKHNDCAFHIFTNGTLIDEEFCKKVKKVGNISFALSVEGYEETNDGRRGEGVFQKVMHAMDIMKANGLLYGVSICYTSKNIEVVTSDEFLDMLIEKGCRLAWYFHYMPVGNDAALDLLPSNEQREYMYHRVREIRGMKTGKQIFAMDFQNDAEFVGGCIAGGKNYLHINPNGDVEPCVFIHYSGANIKEKSLLECLQQPLFMQYHNNMPFNDNMLRPCPMLENPERLRKMVHESGAKSTDMTSPEPVDDLCNKTTPYAERWEKKADELWKENRRAKEEKKKA
ncbi:MAG: radical SAM protein [Lachnospiraceae bacterium]|nr:radical SAM protein [Lachnospiraceae bacterium]